ncbi:hypothetical protein NHX12_004832, partial [Muraenolepis orangiensis]
MADLPIAPGQVYIEVEYDYEYKVKDLLVHIQEGECFLLVKKTNDDWWQVRRDESSKAFYVPAQYVREVRKALMPPPKALLPPGAGRSPPRAGRVRPKPGPLVLDSSADRHESSYHRHSPSSPTSPGSPPAGQRRDSNHRAQHSPLDPHRDPPDVLVPGGAAGCPPQPGQKGGGCDTLPRSRARSPELARLARLALDVDSAGESVERRTNDSESGDELSSSSTEHLQ